MVLSSSREAARLAEKIQPDLQALSATVARLRTQGKRIVHAHGVFDLLHVGHIRHLNEAKSFGDVLVVTLTEDAHVNKGPNRPAFTESLRAESMASLEAVDYVAINRSANAIEAIDAIKPDVYVKGPDYKRAEDDLSGGISLEESAVRSHGGVLQITEDVTYSSSALINQHLSPYSDDVQRYLGDLRSRHSARDIHAYVDRLRTMKVVVAGEAILDEYVYCDQMGKSSKDPVLAMRYLHSEMHAGGALAVANHLADFCSSVELVTYLGENEGEERFVRSHLHPRVRANFVYKRDSPTIVKRRFVERVHLTKLLEIYVINDEPLKPAEEEQFCSLLDARLGAADLVLVADFGHGLMTPASRALVEGGKKFLAINTQVNAANVRYHAISNYRRADYICINESELRLDARDRTSPLSKLVHDLSGKLECSRFLVTRGTLGLECFFDGEGTSAPSLATNVVDRVGSGDAVLALTSACVASGAPAEVVAFIGNVIGAQKVQIVGNSRAVERLATYKFVEALLK